MSAKEFRKENNFTEFTKLTGTGIDNDYEKIDAFAEAYLKHRIESITDEEIIEKYELKLSVVQEVIINSDDNEDVSNALVAERFLKGFLDDLKAYQSVIKT